MSELAVPTTQTDNDRTRVTQWQFTPWASTGYHKHEYDYVIVPITTGTLAITGPDGVETRVDLEAGVSYFRQAGVEHDVRNANDFPFSFVEVEFRQAP